MATARAARQETSGHAAMRDMLRTSLLAAIVGALTGVLAIWVRVAISFVTGLAFRQQGEVEFRPPMENSLGAWVILVPAVGALAGYLVVRFLAHDDRIRGASEIVRSVAMRRGRVSSRRLSGHAVATIVSVGSGGSAGREGAIVQLGAALGRLASLLTGASIRHRKVLLAAGGAAAIGATFNTPIAGVIFASEVILVEWSTRSFVPLTVASAMGTLVASKFLGDQPSFPIPPYELVTARELILYVGLGILCGLLAIVTLRLLGLADRVFATVPGPVWIRPVAGGLLVGIIGFLVPEAFGVGYETVQQALSGAFVDRGFAVALALILVAKILAFSVTRGSGGASGAFSPSLFIGAALGGVYGGVVHYVFPEWTASSGAYALVGMAAVYAAITRASLTAVVMLYEMTHTFSIVIPLMIAVVVADALAKAYGEGNFYRLGRGADKPSVETDASVNILDVVPVGEIMSRPVDTVSADAPVRTVVDARFRTGHQGYPVVDGAGKLVGIVTSTDMRRKVKEGELDRPVRDFMTPDPVCVTPTTTAHEALTEMVRLDVGHLPVVDEKDPSRLVGFLTRTDLVGVERRLLEEEVPGEAFLARPISQMRAWGQEGRKLFHRGGGRPPP
ncbi:MAG TPA: chloride channel protein [Candidatus Thermoplasmatota archaeon]|nr:chloride channel protein [Candidatus Thermoplasmatota archaeon]